MLISLDEFNNHSEDIEKRLNWPLIGDFIRKTLRCWNVTFWIKSEFKTFELAVGIKNMRFCSNSDDGT